MGDFLLTTSTMSLSGDTTSFPRCKNCPILYHRKELLNIVDPLSQHMWSSKQYDPLIHMMTTWFLWRLELLWTFIPTLVLITILKMYLAHAIEKNFISLGWDNCSTLSFKKSALGISVPFSCSKLFWKILFCS